jgi:hypothetical protein
MPKASASRKRNLLESRLVPEPITRFGGKPEIFQAQCVRTSTGFDTRRRMVSGLQREPMAHKRWVVRLVQPCWLVEGAKTRTEAALIGHKVIQKSKEIKSQVHDCQFDLVGIMKVPKNQSHRSLELQKIAVGEASAYKMK